MTTTELLEAVDHSPITPLVRLPVGSGAARLVGSQTWRPTDAGGCMVVLEGDRTNHVLKLLKTPTAVTKTHHRWGTDLGPEKSQRIVERNRRGAVLVGLGRHLQHKTGTGLVNPGGTQNVPVRVQCADGSTAMIGGVPFVLQERVPLLLGDALFWEGVALGARRRAGIGPRAEAWLNSTRYLADLGFADRSGNIDINGGFTDRGHFRHLDAGDITAHRGELRQTFVDPPCVRHTALVLLRRALEPFNPGYVDALTDEIHRTAAINLELLERGDLPDEPVLQLA